MVGWVELWVVEPVNGWVDGKVELLSRRMVGRMVLWVVEPVSR